MTPYAAWSGAQSELRFSCLFCSSATFQSSHESGTSTRLVDMRHHQRFAHGRRWGLPLVLGSCFAILV